MLFMVVEVVGKMIEGAQVELIFFVFLNDG